MRVFKGKREEGGFVDDQFAWERERKEERGKEGKREVKYLNFFPLK